MAKIQEYIINIHKYDVDHTYQRPSNAWSNEDNQCLIDSILKGEPLPLFFLNYNSDKKKFYVVDGQQRLNAIKKFYDNKVKLNKKFSKEEYHGKTFSGENSITDEQRQQFLDYPLQFYILDDYSDEKVRLIFSRLQRGKPLTLGERLNAKPGKIVLTMRRIASHPFIAKSIGISKERYGNFPDAARILFYEKHGCKDSGTPAINSFFEENKNLSEDSKEYKEIQKVLNFLRKCFPADNYQFLSKHAWVHAVYTMIRELSVSYALKDNEKLIRNFVEDFHNKVRSEDFRGSQRNYQKFYDISRGGWSEKLIALRKKILIEEFLKKNDIREKDEKRQISDDQKVTCFTRHPKCHRCNKSFKDYKEPEYHHKLMHAKGGESNIENIMVLCSECHDKIHGSEKLEMPSEEDLEEDLEE